MASSPIQLSSADSSVQMGHELQPVESSLWRSPQGKGIFVPCQGCDVAAFVLESWIELGIESHILTILITMPVMVFKISHKCR